MSEKQPLVITKESHAVAILMGEAIDLCNERGKNYNAGRITKEDYNVFPLRYHAGEMHKEALRACSWVEQGNIAKIREHVRDVVVWAAFLYEETSHYKELDEAIVEAAGFGAIEFAKAGEPLKASCGSEYHAYLEDALTEHKLCAICGHSRGCPCHGK